MPNSSTGSIGFIGLGAMGAPMCHNLARKASVPVIAFDLDHNRIDQAVDYGAIAADDLAQVATADLIFVCLPGESETLEVCIAKDGLLQHMTPNKTLVDCTTTTVSSNHLIASELNNVGVNFADAPVARGVLNAVEGTLSITVGASAETFRLIEKWLLLMGTEISHCGPIGSGTVMKLINNMVLFQNVSALAEAMAIATRAGINRNEVFKYLSLGSADSFALRRHGEHMTSGEYPTDRFPTAYSHKDLGYLLDLASELGVDAAGASLVQDRFEEVIRRGLGNLYSPVIYRLFEDE
jgi:3-hydroxyisobutyrate dehydrogenase-like beta-hydroxyacid dehydrogenase